MILNMEVFIGYLYPTNHSTQTTGGLQGSEAREARIAASCPWVSSNSKWFLKQHKIIWNGFPSGDEVCLSVQGRFGISDGFL